MKRIFTALTILSLTGLYGCTPIDTVNPSVDQNNETITQSVSQTALTSFYPIYIFTLAVTKGTPIKVTNLTGSQGGCLHNYQLTTDDMRLITTSDTFIINGSGMETSFIEKAIAQNPEMIVVDSSLGIELVEEDEEHEHVHDPDHENSHIWLSVSNAITQVNNIASQLSEVYPEYEQQFIENAKNYSSQLEEIKPETKNYDFNVISFHTAFEFLAYEMGFEVTQCVEVEENMTPSASFMASLVTMCNEGKIDYILCADDIGKVYAESLSSQTGIPILVLNPFTSIEEDPKTYIIVQKSNIEALKAVLENE